MLPVLFSLACASAYAAVQEDIPFVESPDVLPPIDETTTLEDQPAVDDLPDWLIDIPPAAAGSGSAPTDRPLRQYENADENVVSESRMFSVGGGDALRMGAIASHADELRGRLYKMLGIDNRWKHPISIRLVGNTTDPPTPNPIRTRVRIVGGHPVLQIRIFAGGGISIIRLDEAIITALLYEFAMRGIQSDALPDYIEMPHWLITGICQSILWQMGRVDRRLYQNLFNKGEMMAPESIMDTPNPSELDAASRRLYEVSCGVLIMGLIHQKGAPDQLRNLLSESLTQEGKLREVLSAHFHEMEESNSLSKWWALELASLSRPDAMETLTPIETEQQLKEALLITAMHQDTRIPYTVSVADAQALMSTPDWQSHMRERIEQLTALSMRCFPGYRAIISEYIRAIGQMLKGSKPEEVMQILSPLKDLRDAYMEASIRGRDYLDWFEITHLGGSNRENFDSYMEAMRLLRRESPGPRSPISRYLDDIETLHSLKEGEALPDRLRPAPPSLSRP